MINYKITPGIYRDLRTWIMESDIYDKIFRVWVKNPKWDGKDHDLHYIDEVCTKKFFTEFIVLPDGDILIGMQSVNKDGENIKYSYLDYYKLSEIEFQYIESDNVFMYEEDDNEYDDYQMSTDEECEYIKDGLDSESN